jgi:hypothetical protein
VLAGISGAAIAPKFVWQIEQFVIWSLIKFIAALAGIRSATPFAKLVTHQPVEIIDFLPGLIFIAAAFGWAGIHFDLHKQREAFSRQPSGFTATLRETPAKSSLAFCLTPPKAGMTVR